MTEEQRQAFVQNAIDTASGEKPVAVDPILEKKVEEPVIVEKTEPNAKVEPEKVADVVGDFDEEGVFIAKIESPVAAIEDTEESEAVFTKRFGRKAVEIQSALERNEAIEAELQALKNDLEKAKNTPRLKLSDIAKEGYDAKELDDLVEYVNLIKKDTSKMTDVDVLKEAFVLDNKNLSRADAEKKFSFTYKRLYDVSALDSDENSDEIEERTFNLETDSKIARAKLDEAIKNAVPPVKAEAEPTPENVVLKKAVELHVQSIPNILSSLPKTKTSNESIVEFKSGKDVVKISMTADEQAQLQKGLEYHLSGESNYDKEGKLSHGNPMEVLSALAHNIFIDKERAAWKALGAKEAMAAIHDKGKVKIGQQPQIDNSGKATTTSLREFIVQNSK